MEDQEFIKMAIDLAESNIQEGGGPFGAVIVKNGTIVARGTNRVTYNNDPTAHAEIQAIREAGQKLGTFDLKGCSIYTSCEPCPMCFSAIYWARLDAVYYAATQHDAEKAGFDDAFIYKELEKTIENRSIPFVKLEVENSCSPFDDWNRKIDKQAY